jgi:rhodanese-related sulfurtransferase
MRKKLTRFSLFVIALFLVLNISTSLEAKETCKIHQATLLESKEETPEISTEELMKLLAEKLPTVFDARPFKEYAVSHIPGALNLSAKPGVEKAVYVSDAAEVGRVVKGNKAALIVLYCNGMY